MANSTTGSVRDRVLAVIDQEIADVGPETKDDAKLADLGLDSLDTFTLADEIEKEFSCTVTDEECEVWKTVGDVVRTVEAKLRA